MGKLDSYSDAPGVSNTYSGREFQNRCSSERVCKLVFKLTTSQKEAIKRVGFGVFIDMKHVAVNISLIAFLVKELDTRNNTISIHGKIFILNKDSFEEIIGVYDGGEEIFIESQDESDSFVGALLGSNKRLVIRQLCTDLDEDKDADELFVVRFVLAVIGTILCPLCAIYLKLSYVTLLSDVRGIKNKNWASHCLKFLMDSIRHYKVRQLKYLSGCILFLQVIFVYKLTLH